MTGVGAWLAERAFGRPRGVLGRIGGRAMARMNAPAERRLVALAELGESDRVLVLGPGPGVGLAAAGARAGRVVGVDPSPVMLAASRRRCAELVGRGRVHLVRGVAEATGQPAESATAALAVNTVHLWPDRRAAFAEVYRVLRPGGLLLLSAHARWLPGGPAGLIAAVEGAGFHDVRTWRWEPPGRWAGTAVQLRARRPGGHRRPVP